MRYPIFSFDGDDLFVFDSLDDIWKNLEVYDIAYPEILLDSDGRLLTKSDAGNDRVSLSDSGAEPDPERLRSMLIHALRKRGQEWSDDAALETLIPVAQATWHKATRDVTISQTFSRLLRFLRLRRPTS